MTGPLNRAVLVAALPLVMSCALFRPEPVSSPALEARPAAPPATALLTADDVPESAVASRFGLAGARTMLLVGWVWPAELLLAEVATRARAAGDGLLEARALTLQGILAWNRDDPGEAIALLGAANTADPVGFVGQSARRTAEMIGRLGDRASEIATMRAHLNAARTGLRTSEDEAHALETEVKALRRQLDELKQLHIQIESEKQDDPS